MIIRILAPFLIAAAASLAGAAAGQAQSYYGDQYDGQPDRFDGGWRACASENGFCPVPYPTAVRFGANGRYVTLRVSRGVQCSNRVFGDPAVGVVKHCDYQLVGGGPPGGGGGLTYCAAEDGTCYFRGPAQVYYGANGRFTSRYLFNGTACSNSVFGDPAPGQQKACYLLR